MTWYKNSRNEQQEQQLPTEWHVQKVQKVHSQHGFCADRSIQKVPRFVEADVGRVRHMEKWSRMNPNSCGERIRSPQSRSSSALDLFCRKKAPFGILTKSTS